MIKISQPQTLFNCLNVVDGGSHFFGRLLFFHNRIWSPGSLPLWMIGLMFPQMNLDQVRTVEAQAAVIALVRLLPRVDPFVSYQTGFRSEAQRAVRTVESQIGIVFRLFL